MFDDDAIPQLSEVGYLKTKLKANSITSKKTALTQKWSNQIRLKHLSAHYTDIMQNTQTNYALVYMQISEQI